MVRVKICGIKTLAEANLAVNYGANAIGFIFANSSRKIMAETAREISLSLPPFVSKVGVFVNEADYVVQELASFCQLDLLQFHGDETPEYCKGFSQKAIKAIAVKDQSYLDLLPAYQPYVKAFLLDTYHPEQRGGTGESFNWQLAVAAKEYGKIILAGGINASNVGQAIRQVQPYAIDLSSGVEESGVKSEKKLTEFFNELRRSLDECS